MMYEFYVMLEFKENHKNNQYLKSLLDKDSVKQYIQLRARNKYVIHENLFNAIQFIVERSKVSYISLYAVLEYENNELEKIKVIEDATLFDSNYDTILRKIRYDRTLDLPST